MSKWPTTKISDICTRIAMGPFGSNIKVDNFVPSGVPVLNGANLAGFKLKEDSFNYVTENKAEELKNSLAYRGDIVVTHRGTLGQIVYIPYNSRFDKYLISQSQFLLRVDSEKADSRFLTYFFHSIYGQYLLLSNASQVGVPALARPTSTFKSLEIPLPPLKIQKKIADLLCLLDKKIQLNAQINQNLEQQAQAIFKSWFVDFEPFQDGKFVDSELGPIPEGWQIGMLKDVLNLIKEPISPTTSNSLPYLPIDTIPMKSLGISGFRPHEEAQSSLIRFRSNDILIGAMRVYFHRVVLAPCDGITRTTCFVLRSKNECYREFNLLLCNQDSSIDYAQNTSKGSTMPYAVWDGAYSNLRIVIPPVEIVERFSQLTSPMINVIRDAYVESNRLATLRDTLLPKLMSGEIDVSEVEV